MRALVLSLGLVLCAGSAWADQLIPANRQTVTFPSADGVVVTADLWIGSGKTATFIVLFHQAGWSRGEYRNIAPRLSMMGFNVMAVDQRSGGKVAGVKNATHAAAKKAGKKTDYVSALPDMRAAVSYARKRHAKGKLLIWGSSYSAALVLRLAAEIKPPVDGVLSFAPGEYFGKLGKSKTWIRQAASKLAMPVFMTSAKSEAKNWKAIFDAIPGTGKIAFVPKTRGQHGSRALWTKFPDSPSYWGALAPFLAKFY